MGHRGAPPGWSRAALALFAVAVGTNIPTPLLLVYRERLDLSSATLTAIFGVYAAGLMPAFLIGGPLSDRFGRRRLVVPATALSAVASLAFLPAAHSVPLLFLARFFQGLVSGAVFSVGSAWLAELAPPGAAGRRAAVAMSAGFSAGALASGLLGEFAPAPTATPYLLHVLLVAVALVAIRRLPETVPVRQPHSAPPPAQPLIVPGGTAVLLTVLFPVAVCVYAFPSVVIAALPLLIRLPGDGVLVTGALAGLTLAAAALAAPLQRRFGRATAAVGASCGAAGYGVAAVAAGSGSAVFLVPAALLLGTGGGLSLAAGLALVARLANPTRRGALSGVFFSAAYLGFAAPIATATLAHARGPVVPLVLAAAVTAALAVRLGVHGLRIPSAPLP